MVQAYKILQIPSNGIQKIKIEKEELGVSRV